MEGEAIFAKIAYQISNSCRRKLISPTHAKVYLPGGFPYMAFNSVGCVSPWSILSMVEVTRVVCNHSLPGDDRTMIDAKELSRSHLLFTVSTHTYIEPEFYDLTTLKGPVEMDVKVTHIGSSSYKTSVSIYLPNFEKPLIKNDTSVVIVGKQSRKPIPFPEWWRQKHAVAVVGGIPLKLQVSSVPNSGVQEHEVIVPLSDMNGLDHVSWASYLKYSLDAFRLQKLDEGHTSGRGSNVKEFSLVYKSECNAGDRLTVKFWQMTGNKNRNVFHLLRSSELVSECVVECYPVADTVTSKL